MNESPRPLYLAPAQIQAETARFMTRVYAWMTVGILLTFGVAMEVSSSEALLRTILGNPLVFWAMIIAQVGAVFFLSAAISRISSTAAVVIYLAYAALTGATLSGIFLVYTHGSIAQVFALTACSFAGLSAYGLVTGRDLGPVGSFCTMGLFGLVAYGFVAMFFPSWWGTPFDRTMSLVGVIVFAGLTAYDTQKIKQLNVLGNEGTDEDRKEAIMGALVLYLDFINLFLELLRLMGKKRD